MLLNISHPLSFALYCQKTGEKLSFVACLQKWDSSNRKEGEICVLHRAVWTPKNKKNLKIKEEEKVNKNLLLMFAKDKLCVKKFVLINAKILVHILAYF